MSSLRQVLEELLGDRAARFTEQDIQALEASGYTDREALSKATRDGLYISGLKPGKADELIAAAAAAATAGAPIGNVGLSAGDGGRIVALLKLFINKQDQMNAMIQDHLNAVQHLLRARAAEPSASPLQEQEPQVLCWSGGNTSDHGAGHAGDEGHHSVLDDSHGRSSLDDSGAAGGAMDHLLGQLSLLSAAEGSMLRLGQLSRRLKGR